MIEQDIVRDLETSIAIPAADAACSLSDEALSDLKQTSRQLQLAETFEQGLQEELAKAAELSQKIHDRSQTFSLVSEAHELAVRHLGAVKESVEELSRAKDQSVKTLRDTAEVISAATRDSDVAQQALQQADELNRQQTFATSMIGSIVQQSGLLALNATILAARSGQDDHGLVMMARDVQDLARQAAQIAELLNNQMAAMDRTLHVAATALGSIRTNVAHLEGISATLERSLDDQSLISSELSAQISASTVALDDASTILAGESPSEAAGAGGELEILDFSNELTQQFTRLKQAADSFLHQIVQSP